jgi:precorrin-2/cobalt-factor-2 C20-methyltransferase
MIPVRGKLTIVGCGPGGQEYLTAQTDLAVQEAEFLCGPRFLLDLFPGAKAERVVAGADALQVVELISPKLDTHKVVLLVTGDPGLHSLARPVTRLLGRERVQIVPGISAVQVAFARLAVPWEKARIFSLHGLPAESVPAVLQQFSVAPLAAVLCSPTWTPRRVLEQIAGSAGCRTVHVLSDLGRPTEYRSSGRVADLALRVPGGRGLSLVILTEENSRAMNDGQGVFWGLGLGPGDPELVTLKARRLIQEADCIVVPKSSVAGESLALEIARPFVGDKPVLRFEFPMRRNERELAPYWTAAAKEIAARVERGERVVFLTLGDCLTYSTYCYVLQELRKLLPDSQIRSVPGVTSFAAAAAATNFSLGERDERIAVVPVPRGDLDPVRRALEEFDTVVLMKVAKRLPAVVRLLREMGLDGRAVFASHVSQGGEFITRDLTSLLDSDRGYLSVILVRGRLGESR